MHASTAVPRRPKRSVNYDGNKRAAIRAENSEHWRCATIASLVLCAFAALFMVVALGVDDVMNAETEFRGEKNSVRVGYFSHETCYGDRCTDSGTRNDRTCENASLLDASVACQFLGLVSVLFVVFCNVWELVVRRELVRHMTMSGQVVATAVTLAGNFPLARIRSQAKHSDACAHVIPGLERYGVGPTWVLGLILAALLVFAAFLTYLCRRYIGCCQCCCPVETSQDDEEQYDDSAFGFGAQGSVPMQPVTTTEYTPGLQPIHNSRWGTADTAQAGLYAQPETQAPAAAQPATSLYDDRPGPYASVNAQQPPPQQHEGMYGGGGSGGAPPRQSVYKVEASTPPDVDVQPVYGDGPPRPGSSAV